MGTGICLRGRKWYACTSMTEPTVRARAGMPSAPLRRIWPFLALRSSGRSAIWSDSAEWRYSLVTGRTAVRPPTCTDCGNESRRKSSLPAKGRLRRSTGPVPGSLWTTKKIPREGLLSSERETQTMHLFYIFC